MSRSILDEAHIHPAIRADIAGNHADIVSEVQAAVAGNDVVVVGMAQNPFPKKARRDLAAAGIPYRYLEYGSYFSGWRRRNALKMWTGWPTFPMIFVQGMLIGGYSDLEKLIEKGGSLIVMHVDEQDACLAPVLIRQRFKDRRHLLAGDTGAGTQINDRRLPGGKRLPNCCIGS